MKDGYKNWIETEFNVSNFWIEILQRGGMKEGMSQWTAAAQLPNFPHADTNALTDGGVVRETRQKHLNRYYEEITWI